MTSGRVRMVVATGLFTDGVGVSVDDLGLLPLHALASQLFVRPNPGNCIAAPIKPGEVLDDREVHRHEHPASRMLLVDSTDDVGIGSARNAEVGDRRDLYAPILETGNKTGIR